ncbi:MAG: hypothetical protein JW894_05620 [Bacteroidales bacterium]|nr:hypothetical protein [Bacteroidales bacterium]
MKRLIPLVISTLTCIQLYSQQLVYYLDWNDALRYSQTYPGGTARSVAMGGAFGALGGDFYSVSQNPAGLGVYRKSELVFTPEIYYSNVKSRYFNEEDEDYKYNFNLNNFGYVGTKVFGDEGFVSASFAVGFNRINNFNSSISIQGVNPESSLADYFAGTANNNPLDFYTDALFVDAGNILYDEETGEYYVNPDMLLPGRQVIYFEQSGRMSEWTLAAGFNYNHLLYFGATFGIVPVSYKSNSVISEFDTDQEYLDNRYFRFSETLSVNGAGFNGKFGVIGKPMRFLRLGIAFHTPSIFVLSSTYNTNIQSAYIDGTYFPVDNDGYYVDPYLYDYRILTPAKFIGSIGIMLGKVAIISTDIEYIDYSSMRLRKGTGGEDFSPENQVIKYKYTDAINIKSGAEFRFSSLYLRGGFGYYGSPYSEEDINVESYHLSYSAGIGFRTGNFSFDLGWNSLLNEKRLELYKLSYRDYYTTNLNQLTTRFLATVGFRF